MTASIHDVLLEAARRRPENSIVHDLGVNESLCADFLTDPVAARFNARLASFSELMQQLEV